MSFSFYIDEAYNDFRISNKNIVLVNGVDNVEQQIRTTLKTELGEWFLNTNFGLPYFSSTTQLNDNNNPGILGGKSSAAEIQSQILLAILQVPGVISVDKFLISEQNESRTVFINVDVVAELFDANGISTQEVINISLGVG